MSSKLIIIRGNSGSGKSTVASRLRHALGYGTMLIPQDMMRRDIVRVKDTADNPAIQLIEDIALYGKRIEYNVIIEGILTSERYGRMLKNLYKSFEESYAFYFDVPFEETLRRHQTKSNSKDFSEQEMKAWWVKDDYLNVENEYTLKSDLTEDEVVGQILKTINRI